MHRLLLLLALCFLMHRATAQQGDLRGTVIDSVTTKPVADASVVLHAGSVAKHSTKTDAQGIFLFTSVAHGRYTLQLTGVGYASRSVEVTVSNANQSLGNLPLAAEIKKMDGITVTAQKALVEDKGDRLVYNASADISNAGGTAADVLRKVPSLTVDLNGNVQLRGNSNIKVLLNGKPSAMMARNLADALRQMPASAIKTVEVITSPGAKYDAEGAAGVINIVTYKGLRGFSGSGNAAIGDRNRSFGGRLSSQSGKVSLNVSGSVYQYRNTMESFSVRRTMPGGSLPSILYRSSNADNTGTGGYGELAIDYDPDSLNHLNLAANGWGGNFPNNSVADLKLTALDGAVLQQFRNDSRFHNPYGNGQLDLGWTHTFRKPEQEFSLLGQFSRMPDNYFYTTDRISPLEEIIFREKSTNYSRNKEYTMQADYTHPFSLKSKKDTSMLKLEMGVKAIIRDIGSEVKVEQSPNGKDALLEDPAQANDFDYTQRVVSGYTSLRWSNKAKWNLNAGARLEHTEIDGNFVTTGTTLNSRYNNLIPSVTVSKGLGKNTLKFSYTQRITRPLIWYLNPWVNRSDPKNVSTGNPNLNPEINHAYEVGNTFSGKSGFMLNTTLYWRTTDNAIEYVTRIDTASVSVNQPRNIARRATLGLNVNVSAKPNKNWNLNGGGDVRYMEISSPALNQQNDGVMWNVNLNTSYKLPKDYTLQLFSNLYSGWLSLQRTNTSVGYWYGLSVKKAFWSEKASLTFGMNNPFARGVRQISEESAPSYTAHNEFLYVNRSFRLSFEWRFGQLSSGGGKQGKKIANDDSGR